MSILYNLIKNFLIMALDHEAIYKAYKTATKPVVSIDDSTGAFDKDGSSL